MPEAGIQRSSFPGLSLCRSNTTTVEKRPNRHPVMQKDFREAKRSPSAGPIDILPLPRFKSDTGACTFVTAFVGRSHGPTGLADNSLVTILVTPVRNELCLRYNPHDSLSGGGRSGGQREALTRLRENGWLPRNVRDWLRPGRPNNPRPRSARLECGEAEAHRPSYQRSSGRHSERRRRRPRRPAKFSSFAPIDNENRGEVHRWSANAPMSPSR
jgi:hypothetical protein